MRFTIIGLLISIALMSACSSPNEPKRVPKIYGQIVDADGNPVAFADVCVIPDIPGARHKISAINQIDNTPQKILSVELISFEAIAYSDHIQVKWSTASESNSRDFVLERFVFRNGTFQDLVEVAILKAKGSSISPSEYSVDDKVANNTYQYRLKINDLDGSFGYSSAIQIDFIDSKAQLEVNAPNPFNNYTTIYFNTGCNDEAIFQIVEKSTGNIYHQEQRSFPIGSHSYIWQAKDVMINDTICTLRPGVYIASLKTKDTLMTQSMVLWFNFNSNTCEIPLPVTKTDKNGRFEIDYKWFPDVEEFFVTAETGQKLGNFLYGKSANILVRKRIAGESSNVSYWVGQKIIEIDKEKIEDVRINALKYILNK